MARRRALRPWSLIAAVFAALVTAPTLRAQGITDDSAFVAGWTELVGTEPAHWRVVLTGDAATTATISWSTRDGGTEHRVHLCAGEVANFEVAGTEARTDPANYARCVDAAHSGEYSRGDGELDDAPTYFHHVRLGDLEPGTIQRFLIESDGSFSPPLWFRTAPASGTDQRVVYGGDSRTGWRDRCRVNLMLAGMLESEPDILCLVHGGDYVQEGTRCAQWLRWLSHYELTTSTDGRVLPIVPGRGNHDFGPLYGEVFDLARTDAGAYFEVQLGSDVSILTLDTNASMLGDQFAWMRAALPAARERSRWLLLNYHRPMFPAVKTPSPAAPHWVPLFESNDVDLVLESDGHCMKRTVPIRGGKRDATGVTYIGEGGLGVPQRLPDGSHWYFAEGGFVSSGHHVTRIEFDDDVLRTTFVALVDEFGIASVGSGEPLVAAGAAWRYCATGDPSAEWNEPDFDDALWPEGPAGFGFGDGDDATELAELRGSGARLYLRTRFTVPSGQAAGDELALVVDYDDAFIAYLDGVEVVRACVGAGNGAAATEISSHEAGTPEVFHLAASQLAPGEHVLCLEGHNVSATSSDFSLHPWLVRQRGADVSSAARWTAVDEHVLHVRPGRAAPVRDVER